MTNFIKVQGGTYYLPLEHSNVGMYVHKKEAVLIDSGYTEEDANLIAELLSNKSIKLKAIINTHAHPDNCGGSSYLKKLTDCKVMVTRPERLIMENPTRSNYIPPAESQLAVEIEPHPSAPPPPKVEEEPEGEENKDENEEEQPQTNFVLKEEDIKKALVRPLRCRIDSLLTFDKPFTLSSGKKIKVIDLAGHTSGQVGVKTPDGVLFIADALCSLKYLDQNPIPHVENYVQYKKSLEYLLNVGETHFIPTHGEPMEFSIATEVLYNQQQLKMIEDAIFLHLQIPRTKEELVALIFATFNLAETIPNFYSVSATIIAFLNGMKKLKKITIIHERGKTRWFVKH